MKDFYGNALPAKNNELDYSNTVTINNAFSDTSKKVQYYEPEKDGIFIVGCSYQAGAYAWLVNEAYNNIRLVSCVIASGGAVSQNNGMCPAHKDNTYHCESVRGQWFFIPYK